VAVAPFTPLLQLYVNGLVPPEALAVAEPLPPKQSAFVAFTLTLIEPPDVTVILAVDVHPLAAVIKHE
jgi:hypothetical protein